MSKALAIGDTGNHGGSITSGSSCTTVGGRGMAHYLSSVYGHGIGECAGPHIATTGNSGKTIVNGLAAASVGALGSCGEEFTTGITEHTFIGEN